MIAQFPKPKGPAAVTSSRPGSNMIPLGRALRKVADAYDSLTGYEQERSNEDLALESFLEANERYANALRIASLSIPHALKSWAAERLPALRISYGFSNRIPHESIQANLDQEASLRVVEFADDLVMIARFCRDIDELKIEASTHSHGLEFRFQIKGEPLDPQFAEFEQKSVQQLLNDGSRDNSMKKRIITTDTQIEAHAIALRRRVRLGFSPSF